MKWLSLIFLLQVQLTSLSILHAEGFERQTDPEKTIVVMGSSVASGWATGFEARYDMENGYASRLERYLKPRGYSVVNRSVPGDTTADLLARFDADLEGLHPDFIVIGLSLGNEGIEDEDPNAVFESFEKGMQKIIKKCREWKAITRG